MRRDRDLGGVSFLLFPSSKGHSLRSSKGPGEVLASGTCPHPYSRGKALYVVPPELRQKGEIAGAKKPHNDVDEFLLGPDRLFCLW